MMNKKQKRESGRKYNKYYDPEKGEYNEQYWDDWIDYRDGYRDLNDQTLKKPNGLKQGHWGNIKNKNKKITKHNVIRQKRKQSSRNQY